MHLSSVNVALKVSENMTPGTPKIMKNEFSQMCPGSIWDGPGSFRSSKTMFLIGLQLVNLMKFDNTKFDKVDIEFDPGRRQERRKQYAFDIQSDLHMFAVRLASVSLKSVG